jgi:hypothetical protein
MVSNLPVYLFDGSEADLRGRTSQIEAAGLDAIWDVGATASRNQLLTWIDRDATSSPKRLSVALIDCRTESGDLEQLGFRIVESIRRHAYLWKATRPAIWVDHLSREHEGCARGVGADAVIDDAWVDSDPRAALTRVVEWCQRRPVAPYGRVGEPEVFTDDTSAFDREIEQRDARFRRSFGFAPDELDYMILWGMAGAVELQFLDCYCSEHGWAASARSARKAREKLQQAMRGEREELDRAEPTNAELARRFLADALPGTPDPLAELSWPAFSQIREIRRLPLILTSAFLEADAEAVLDQFLAVVAEAGRRAPPAGSRGSSGGRLELIESTLRRLAADRGEPFLRVHGLVHRSCHALSDAYDDWRRVGDPA